MKKVLLAVVVALGLLSLVACKPKVEGSYTGNVDGMAIKMKFKDGNVTWTVFGMDEKVKYKIDGNEIRIGEGEHYLIGKILKDTKSFVIRSSDSSDKQFVGSKFVKDKD